MPIPEPTLAATRAFVSERHREQIDHGGDPHSAHVLRVHAGTVALLALVPDHVMTPRRRYETETVALLHDVVEDGEFTGVSYATLLGMGYPPTIVDGVRRLGKRPEGVTYQGNMEALAHEGDLGLVTVKLADNRDNSSPGRNASLPPERRGILRRYERSMAVLEAAFERLSGVSPDVDAPAAGVSP